MIIVKVIIGGVIDWIIGEIIINIRIVIIMEGYIIMGGYFWTE